MLQDGNSSTGSPTAMAPKDRSATTVKLQIAGAVFLPLLLLGLWLNSLGFFSPPLPGG
ncbi:hypothetical protein [Synechococcus sp. BSA11S]|uniref:hypothetical protein n=1 Tax=Synechococcus sp. BSA11S TaxID=2599077 RepID=UPI001624B387|nr:hypothetical protein [Synechococcus sp. BSA11S]